jgi:hypothetical protein
MGQVIRAFRQHPHHGPRGLAQEDVAGWAGITQGRLSRIETGPPMLQIDRLIAWAQLLRIPQEYLWFALPEGHKDERADPRRGDSPPARLRRPTSDHRPDEEAVVVPVDEESSLAAERASARGPDLWELHDVLDAASVSQTSLTFAEEACARLDARYAELPPLVLLPELRGQLRHVVGWLRDPQPVAYRQRLCSVAGRLAGLRAWLYFDMAEHAAADAWHEVALSAANEADDQDLCGYLLGAQSLIRTDRQDHLGAAELLEGAQAAVGRAGSPTTRAWLDILEARAMAGTGDRRGFAAAHQRASKRLQRTCLDERRHGMDFAGTTLDITYYTGLSHLLLDEPAAAGSAFQSALDNLPASRVKARAILLLSLAMAAAQDRQPDQAAAKAGEALTIADDQPIGRVWQRAEDVRRAVDAAVPSSAVRELDEHMVEFAGSLERATSGSPR